MSTCRISPTSPGKTIMRSNTTTSTTTVQLQLRRSISVENENGAATLAFLAALVKNSNCSSAKQDGVGGLDAIKKSSSLNSNSLSTEKDCANVPIINQQHVEPIVLSTTSQSSIATLPTTTVNSSSNTNSNSAKSSSISQNLHHQIPSDILDDLASRFIINTPVDERQNLIRICFQIELAHWFYLDFFCGNEEKKLIPCGLKQFALHLFQHIPFLRNYLSEIDKILEDWKEYKLSVPTYGAILVSEDLKNVLLVQSYWAKSSWGFPKGKINEHEDPVHCATREVYEETGFDITNMIIPDHYIECVINYQYTRLYIIRNVSISTTFSPRTRKEIKCCEWFPLDSLPTTKNDPNCKSQLGINANSFFMIIPFMKRLKKWINDNRSGIERKYSSSSPITTFNNNNGCGNYYGNNASGNYNYNNNSNINGLVKQHSSAKKIILDIKKSGNCTSNNINNSNSNQLKGTINNNSSNNNNNQKSKRQRHKSMGDIDGINLKLNFIKNNSSNNGNNNINRSQQQQQQQQQQQSNGYDNNKIHNNSTPKNNCNNKDNNDMKKCFFEDNLKYSSGKHINSKRQLFSCISTDGSTNSDKIITNNNINNNNITNNNNILNNNINSNKKDKEKNSQIFNNINSNNNNNNNKNGGNNNINNNNSIRSRTKSLGQNNNNLQQSIISNGVQRKNSNENKDGGNMRKKSHNLQQQHQTQQQQHEQKQRGQIVQQQQQQQQGHKEFIINNNNINVIEIENKLINNHHNFLINSCTNQQRQFMKLKQQHEELKAEQQKNQINSQHIVTDNIKFNPNFDSWTNFSFTKNFIANVFC